MAENKVKKYVSLQYLDYRSEIYGNLKLQKGEEITDEKLNRIKKLIPNWDKYIKEV